MPPRPSNGLFTKARDLELIKLVRQYPLLYDQNSDKYSDTDAREVTWQMIGDKMSIPGVACKCRWVNIRDMMRRRVRERAKYKDRRYQNYKYEKELRFLTSTFNDIEGVVPNTNDDSRYFSSDEDHSQETTYNGLEAAESEHSDDHQDRKDIVFHSVPIQGEGRRIEFDAEDAIDVFLMNVGSTLRKFKPYYLNQAKSKIFQVISDFELQQIIEIEGHPPGRSTS